MTHEQRQAMEAMKVMYLGALPLQTLYMPTQDKDAAAWQPSPIYRIIRGTLDRLNQALAQDKETRE